jgi:hypothetical protein
MLCHAEGNKFDVTGWCSAKGSYVAGYIRYVSLVQLSRGRELGSFDWGDL